MDERPGVSPRIRRFALVAGAAVWIVLGALMLAGLR